MANTITLDMAMFDIIRPNLTQGMIDTINKSPTLVAQLTQYNNLIGTGTKAIGVTQGTGSELITDSQSKAKQIVLDLNDLWAQGKTMPPYVDQNGIHRISPEGGFVGVLSHEVGHYVNDTGDTARLNSMSVGDPGFATTRNSIYMYREGEAAYNNWVVRHEVASNGGVEVDLRGANYQYGQTANNNIYSNLLVEMDKINSSMLASGADALTIKGVLQDVSASYMALQHPSNAPGMTYWDSMMSSMNPQAPSQAALSDITLVDPNHDGHFSSVTTKKVDGTTLTFKDTNSDGKFDTEIATSIYQNRYLESYIDPVSGKEVTAYLHATVDPSSAVTYEHDWAATDGRYVERTYDSVTTNLLHYSEHAGADQNSGLLYEQYYLTDANGLHLISQNDDPSTGGMTHKYVHTTWSPTSAVASEQYYQSDASGGMHLVDQTNDPSTGGMTHKYVHTTWSPNSAVASEQYYQSDASGGMHWAEQTNDPSTGVLKDQYIHATWNPSSVITNELHNQVDTNGHWHSTAINGGRPYELVHASADPSSPVTQATWTDNQGYGHQRDYTDPSTGKFTESISLNGTAHYQLTGGVTMNGKTGVFLETGQGLTYLGDNVAPFYDYYMTGGTVQLGGTALSNPSAGYYSHVTYDPIQSSQPIPEVHGPHVDIYFID